MPVEYLLFWSAFRSIFVSWCSSACLSIVNDTDRNFYDSSSFSLFALLVLSPQLWISTVVSQSSKFGPAWLVSDSLVLERVWKQGSSLHCCLTNKCHTWLDTEWDTGSTTKHKHTLWWWRHWKICNGFYLWCLIHLTSLKKLCLAV